MQPIPTRADGRQARKALPRRDLALLTLPNDRDPVGIIESQHANRLQELIPVRISRMLQSPFAFYRGTAGVMANDLRDAPTTGFEVVACGDAHISNFGFYASPERALVFDVNDFDEAAVAPWEWDVRRLVTSVQLAARGSRMPQNSGDAASFAAADSYRKALRKVARVSASERYFTRIDDSALARRLGKKGRKQLGKVTQKARERTSQQVLQKLAVHEDDGQVRIVDQPPLLHHVEHASLTEVAQLFEQYRETVRDDVAFLLRQYQPVDFALRVVGVGSVGTRCYLIALQGPSGESLFLQAKEAGESVLITHGGLEPKLAGAHTRSDATQGERVVAAQRVLQATSDPFLGWISGPAGEQGREQRRPVDYYWRQFKDMKGSIDPSTLNAKGLREYASVCAALLARAHSQSPVVSAIDGYLGSSDAFATAMTTWSRLYADVAELDFEALGQAVKSGRLRAAT